MWTSKTDMAIVSFSKALFYNEIYYEETKHVSDA